MLQAAAVLRRVAGLELFDVVLGHLEQLRLRDVVEPNRRGGYRLGGRDGEVLRVLDRELEP